MKGNQIVRYLNLFLVVSLIAISFAPNPGWAVEPEDLYREARDHLQNKEYAEARDKFEKFTNQYPNHPRYWDAYFGYGQALYRLNKLRKSNQIFSSVRKNHPDKAVRGDALFGQIQIAILEDKVALARALSESFLNIHDDHILRSTVKRRLKLLKEMDTSSTASDTRSKQSSDTSTSTSSIPGQSEVNSGQSTGNKNKLVTAPPLEKGPSGGESSDNVDPPLRFEDGLLMPDLNNLTDPSSSQEGSTSGTTSLNRENPPKFQAMQKENQNLGTQVSRLQDQLNQLQNENKQLSSRFKKIRTQLEKKITNLASDTSIHKLADEIELSDTASGTLQGSLDKLRSEAETALENGNFKNAQRINQKILKRSPLPEDYLRQARIARQAQASKSVIEEAYRMAINKQSPPDPSPVLEFAEWLADQERFDQLNTVLSKYQDQFSTLKNSDLRSRWALLRGKAQIHAGNTGRAFFHLMEAIRRAPESSQASEARSIINSEF